MFYGLLTLRLDNFDSNLIWYFLYISRNIFIDFLINSQKYDLYWYLDYLCAIFQSCSRPRKYKTIIRDKWDLGALYNYLQLRFYLMFFFNFTYGCHTDTYVIQFYGRLLQLQNFHKNYIVRSHTQLKLT